MDTIHLQTGEVTPPRAVVGRVGLAFSMAAFAAIGALFLFKPG